MIRQQLSPKLIAVLAAILLIPCAFVAWYYAPVRVESLDSFAYCKCGYSTVRFHDGRITMVQYHHDTPKAGQQIGTYRVRDSEVELDITFDGKSHRQTLAIDNIGILAPEPTPMRYYALNGNSAKTYVRPALDRLHLWINDLWSR